MVDKIYKQSERLLLIFSLFVILGLDGSSQIVHMKGSPVGINIHSDTKSLNWYDPGFIEQEINAVREKAVSDNKLLHFAVGRETDLNPSNSGILTENDEQISTWHLLISSDRAESIGIIFSKFKLKEGEKVFLYDPGMTQISGPYTSLNNKQDGVLAIIPVPGSRLVIEYQYNKHNRGELEVGQVSHDVLGVFGQNDEKDIDFGNSGPCNVDINCPEGDEWSNEKRAVVKLLIDNLYLGSGTLVNNTSYSNIAYILTAAHVIDTPFEANRTIAIFNYESPWCDGPDGSVSKSISSADLVSTNDEIDVSLIKLSEFPPILYKPYMAGWDVSGTLPTNQTGIHHPSGDVKKISYDDDSPIISTFESRYIDGFWKILQWDSGTTEGGSSGSPLFDPNHRVIGTLTGGEARCGNSVNDYYARLDISYDISTSSLESLKPWLDANQTGATVVNGRDPYVNNFAQSDTLFNGVESEFYLTNYSGGPTGLTTGFNSDSILAYAEKFNSPSTMEITDVILYLGKSNYVSSVDSVSIYILDDNNGPGDVLAEKTILIKESRDTFFLRVDFEQTVSVTGTFYVAYQNWYVNTADSDPRQFAVFHGSAPLPGSDYAWFKDSSGWYPFAQHPFDPGENTLYIKVVLVETGTIVSIAEEAVKFEKVRFFPNPFREGLFVELEDRTLLINSAKIMDLTGKTIYINDAINANNITFTDLSSLKPGLYLMSLKIGDNYQMYKIVKE